MISDHPISPSGLSALARASERVDWQGDVFPRGPWLGSDDRGRGPSQVPVFDGLSENEEPGGLNRGALSRTERNSTAAAGKWIRDFLFWITRCDKFR
jgi:hypothetical protein